MREEDGIKEEGALDVHGVGDVLEIVRCDGFGDREDEKAVVVGVVELAEDVVYTILCGDALADAGSNRRSGRAGWRERRVVRVWIWLWRWVLDSADAI
jgi:hypothetical protein